MSPNSAAAPCVVNATSRVPQFSDGSASLMADALPSGTNADHRSADYRRGFGEKSRVIASCELDTEWSTPIAGVSMSRGQRGLSDIALARIDRNQPNRLGDH